MRRFLIVMTLATTGCSWLLQDHLQSEYSGHSEPVCSTGKGLAALDGVFAVLNFAGAVAAGIGGPDPVTGQSSTPIVAGGVAFGLVHLLSAATGGQWADDCRAAREKWDAKEGESRGREAASASAEAKRYDTERSERAIVDRAVTYGDRPVYCSPISADTGPCFVKPEACEAERGEGSAPCEQREVAACFNARRTLDDSSANACAISVKDCEARREKAADDPDFTKVQKRCGVYRVRPRSAPPAPVIPGSGGSLAKPDEE